MELTGLSVSAGTAQGKAKIVKNLEDLLNVNKGEIIVANYPSPAFIPLMLKAAALVAEEGNMLSHPAIVARELGLPCIVKVKNATTLIKNGNVVYVDANKGKIVVKDGHL